MPDLTRRQLGLGAALLVPFAGRLAQAQTIKRGGTLTMALPTEPPTLVSLTTTAQSSVILSAKVTEGLLTYDFDLKPQPQLATAWSMTPDGLQYEFKLRQGVKWHDGQDFTSADVAFSIMLLKKVHPRGQSTFQNLDRVETPDPSTAIFVLNKPAPYLLTALLAAESPIVARHIYAPSGDAIAANPNELAPIGTGPFLFKEWVHGSHVIYERNPHYWDAGKPYLDRFIARFMTDASARSIALETGEVDVAGWSPVPLTDVKRLSQLPNLVIETHGNEYQNNLFYRIEFNTENKYFRDVRVRQAVAHAIDKKIILRLAFLGYGVIANGPVSPNLKAFFDVDLPAIPYDPKRSEALLDEAGFPPEGRAEYASACIRKRRPGAAVDIAQYTKDALRRIGIGRDRPDRGHLLLRAAALYDAGVRFQRSGEHTDVRPNRRHAALLLVAEHSSWRSVFEWRRLCQPGGGPCLGSGGHRGRPGAAAAGFRPLPGNHQYRRARHRPGCAVADHDCPEEGGQPYDHRGWRQCELCRGVSECVMPASRGRRSRPDMLRQGRRFCSVLSESVGGLSSNDRRHHHHRLRFAAPRSR